MQSSSSARGLLILLLLKKENVSVLSILWAPSTVLDAGPFTCGISLSLRQLQKVRFISPFSQVFFCSKQPVQQYMAALLAGCGILDSQEGASWVAYFGPPCPQRSFLVMLLPDSMTLGKTFLLP